MRSILHTQQNANDITSTWHFLYLQCMTIEFCNEQLLQPSNKRSDSPTSNQWILKRGISQVVCASFATSNKRILPPVIWVLQQDTDNYWKVMPSEVKLLNMAILMRFHVYIFVFAWSKFLVWKLKKSVLHIYFPSTYNLKHFNLAYSGTKFWQFCSLILFCFLILGEPILPVEY